MKILKVLYATVFVLFVFSTAAFISGVFMLGILFPAITAPQYIIAVLLIMFLAASLGVLLELLDEGKHSGEFFEIDIKDLLKKKFPSWEPKTSCGIKFLNRGRVQASLQQQ